MAQGDPFTMTPSEVVPLEPDYHTVVTPSESMKKEYHSMSATPVEAFELSFKGLTTAEKNDLKAHFNDQSGGYYEFTWQTVPDYIDDSSNNDMVGRWVKKSLRMMPIAPDAWNCRIKFEKDN